MSEERRRLAVWCIGMSIAVALGVWVIAGPPQATTHAGWRTSLHGADPGR
jgi:hypothetical protein